MGRAVPGSSRFHSQAYPPCDGPPLSGFLAGPSFAALFHAATVRGILPSECSPHRNRAPLSGPPAPLRLSTNVLERSFPDLIAAGFPDSHAFDAVAWLPRRLWAPFSRAETRFPVTLGPSRRTTPFRQLHPLRSLDPPASPFAPTRVAPSRRPILSWVCASLKISPSTPRILGPAQTTRA
jgi:hypothetical protein